MPASVARRALLPQLAGYTAASVVALAVDVVVFLALLAATLQPALAGALGYLAGLSLHYTLSVRYVFDAKSAGKCQVRLFGEFAASGLLGLTTTTMVIALATDWAGLPPLVGKLLAVCASFMLVFTVRRTVVFCRCPLFGSGPLRPIRRYRGLAMLALLMPARGA
jgi:putative flippase GtrA